MPTIYFRGGPSLAARPIDVIIDRETKLLATSRGLSIFDRPEGLDRYGGAFEVGPIPMSLRIVKTGRNPHHFEIAPDYPMTFAEYEAELTKIPLKHSGDQT
jgi:hypothetical protein